MTKWKQKYLKKLNATEGVRDHIKIFFKALLNKTNIKEKDMKALMSGANIEIKDTGRFYSLMCHDILECERHRRQNCNCGKTVIDKYYSRVSFGAGSSHESYNPDDYPQYRMGLGVLPNLDDKVSQTFDFLIGLRKKDSKIHTWFQFESERGCCQLKNEDDLDALDNITPIKRVYNMSTVGHIGSTIRYIYNKKNQGPFGESEHNDSDPICLTTSRENIGNYRPILESDSVLFEVVDCDTLRF